LASRWFPLPIGYAILLFLPPFCFGAAGGFAAARPGRLGLGAYRAGRAQKHYQNSASGLDSRAAVVFGRTGLGYRDRTFYVFDFHGTLVDNDSKSSPLKLSSGLNLGWAW